MQALGHDNENIQVHHNEGPSSPIWVDMFTKIDAKIHQNEHIGSHWEAIDIFRYAIYIEFSSTKT